jgi:CO/xanthine dehydrogenase FAD-binding subunit
MKFYILRDYPKTVVNIKTIKPSMNYIKEEGGILKIGALARLEDIAKSSTVKDKWSAWQKLLIKLLLLTCGKWEP